MRKQDQHKLLDAGFTIIREWDDPLFREFYLFRMSPANPVLHRVQDQPFKSKEERDQRTAELLEDPKVILDIYTLPE